MFSSKVHVENQWTGGNAYLCITGIPIGNVPFLCSLSTYQSLFVAIHCFLIIHCYRIALSFWERAQRASSHPKKGEGKHFHFLHWNLLKPQICGIYTLLFFLGKAQRQPGNFCHYASFKECWKNGLFIPNTSYFLRGIPPIAPCCALGIKEDQIELFTSQRPYHGLQALVYTTHT